MRLAIQNVFTGKQSSKNFANENKAERIEIYTSAQYLGPVKLSYKSIFHGAPTKNESIRDFQTQLLLFTTSSQYK